MELQQLKRLSPSRISCLFRCPREFSFRYILEVKEPKSKPLLVGSQFHSMLEGKDADVNELLAADAEYPWCACLRRMVAGYNEAVKPLPPAIAREVVVESDNVKIVADELRMLPDGKFFLSENKTASILDKSKKQMLPNEIQMIAYTAHIGDIADQALLDADKFAGVLYTTTLKPMERRKKGEAIDVFGERLTSSTVVWEIPAEKFDRSKEKWAIMSEFSQRRIDEIAEIYTKHNSIDLIVGNSASCTRFGNKCPYWALCHGEEVDEGSV